MQSTKYFVVLYLAAMLVAQPWLSAIAGAAPASQDTLGAPIANIAPAQLQPRELTGSLDDRRAEYRAQRSTGKDAVEGEEEGQIDRSPLADLPILDDALASKAQRAKGDEVLRVIVHLDYLPHAVVLEDTLARHKDEIDRLESDRQAHLARLAVKRDSNAKTDSANYAAMRALDDAERRELADITERNEAISARIKAETTRDLRQLIEPYQAPVVEQIEKLGGNVEFTMIAGNTIIATIEAQAVAELAKIPGVMRVVEDSLMEGHLNVADNATMVDPSDTSLLGLWDAGQTGGSYDPAVIDSGTDLQHPALANNGSRSNWCSWYLVAANGDSDFGDNFSCDDLQGHGTHVYGIVGSYGSSGYTSHLGMSYGVAKMVSLKAGWFNTSNGRASMYWSDKYNLVERALYNTSQLNGPTAFSDDVDGMNLSYGGDTSLDDTDGGRFWDSVIHTYSNLPVTISAGNSGPSNTLFSDPAVSYNAIVVANYNDRGTTSRNDDIVNSGSTVGPTANNRRKPDIAAPGTSITAPRHNWEGGNSDFTSKTGTSMAAPMVLGVLMDLMDAAVIDELALKALLINTAQKNLPGMNIESDSDGWDEQLGWGAMNAYAAYFHRFDIFQDSVAPRNTAGDYQLYKGSMRDEGSASGGEGRDRATMVWNRHATYNPAAAPTTYYTLADLNMRLYRESDEVLIDFDTDSNDNVHQVRIGAGASDTDVIINAYAWSTSFAHGGATQAFALATEDGFTRVDLPTQFQGIAIWPSSVEPNEEFDITFWLRNDSEIASHDNVFNLELPAGWALLSGIDTQNVGSAQAGGITSQVTYTLRAPNTAVGAQAVTIQHSHNSYNEPYGDFNWNINLTVEVDNTAPNPNPMSFSTPPFNVSTSSVSMTASFASDIHGPVEYYLDYVSSPSFGTGGTDSGWQSSRSYTDISQTPNDEYCYRAWARDNANTPNLTTPSAIECAYTSQETPAGISFGTVTNTSIQAASSSLPNNLTLDSSGLLIRNTTSGTNSGWKQNNSFWNSAGLIAAKGYTFNAQARNGDGDITANSPSATIYTLPNIPAVDSLLTESDSEIKVSLNPNGNSNEAEYFIQNTTAGTDSGWINDTSWSSTGLDCDTFYNFQAKARNGDGVETIIVPLGLQTTAACTVDTDGDSVPDSEDNCTLVPNVDQRDTNGDGYGNVCDPDLNNDGIVNPIDLGLFRAAFFATGAGLDEDFNGDEVVNPIDLGILRAYFFGPPGPSGVAP